MDLIPRTLCINSTHYDHTWARNESDCLDHNPDLPLTTHLTRPDCVNCGDLGCRVCRGGESND